MKTYTVTWAIEVDAENPVAAAYEAMRIQRDEHSTATIFEVKETHSDDKPIAVDVVQSVTADRAFEMLVQQRIDDLRNDLDDDEKNALRRIAEALVRGGNDHVPTSDLKEMLRQELDLDVEVVR